MGDEDDDQIRDPVPADEEIVTQYGATSAVDPIFRDTPRPKDRGGLSLLRGHLTAEEACREVRGYTDPDPNRDRARYATAGSLRDKGFRVWQNNPVHNPNHIRCEPVEGEAWTADYSGAFNVCFDEALGSHDV